MVRVTVCKVEEVPANTALCRRLPDGLHVAVAKLNDGFVAFEHRCPHANGPIGEGKLHGDTIICPWHFFRFDLRTGKAVGVDSILELRLFPVAVRDGEIRIEV